MTSEIALSRLERIKRLYPDLIKDSVVVKVDTIFKDQVRTVFVEGSEIDTSFVSAFGALIDSFEFENDRLYSKIKVLESEELGTRRVEVFIRSKPDTLRDTLNIPVERIVEVERFVGSSGEKLGWWVENFLWGCFGAIMMMILWMYRKTKSPSSRRG